MPWKFNDLNEVTSIPRRFKNIICVGNKHLTNSLCSVATHGHHTSWLWRVKRYFFLFFLPTTVPYPLVDSDPCPPIAFNVTNPNHNRNRYHTASRVVVPVPVVVFGKLVLYHVHAHHRQPAHEQFPRRLAVVTCKPSPCTAPDIFSLTALRASVFAPPRHVVEAMDGPPRGGHLPRLRRVAGTKLHHGDSHGSQGLLPVAICRVPVSGRVVVSDAIARGRC